MPSKKLGLRKQTIDNLVASVHKGTRAAALFAQTISEISGIHPTDIRCLDFLSRTHYATAGELAKITNLTTGAATAMIDRLESAGFVKRKTDANDRRKIIVTLIGVPDKLKSVRNLFANRIPRLLSEYKTEELELITNWNMKIGAILHKEMDALKASKRN